MIAQVELVRIGPNERATNVPLAIAAASAGLIFAVLVAVVSNSLGAFLVVLSVLFLPLIGVFFPAFIISLFLFLNLLIPKVPLIEIPGYIVPIRIEDVFLACALMCLFVRYLIFGEKPAANPLTRWMATFCVLTFLSFLFGLLFLKTVPSTKVGFLFWLRGPEYFAATYLCLLGVNTWNRYRRVMTAFLLFVVLVGVYGMLQEFSLVPIFDAMHINDEIVSIRFFPAFGQDRLYSTFAGPPDFAEFYLIATPILVALFVLTVSRLAKGTLAAVLALSLFCFYLTYARGPLVALVVVLGVCLWLLGKHRLGVLLGPICILPALLFGGFIERISWARDDPFGDLSVGFRLMGGWTSALSAVARSPLLGTGPASLTTMGSASHILEGVGVDGLYFMLSGMWGLLGLGCFLFLISKAIGYQRECVRTSRNQMQRALGIGLLAGTIGLLINGVVVDSFFMSKIAFLYWFLMGLLFAGSALERSDSFSNMQPAARL